jgi:hypothetical protein
MQVIMLVRDPRGVYASRTSGPILNWCRNEQCANPEIGCLNLVDDLKVSGALQGFIEDETRQNNKHASKPMFKMDRTGQDRTGQKKIYPRLLIFLWLSGAVVCI